MGFIEYYKKNSKYMRFFSIQSLPEDVQKDLSMLIDNEDKHIGVYFLKLMDKTGHVINFTPCYYVRSWHPDFTYNEHNIPTGLCFWRMHHTAGGI